MSNAVSLKPEDAVSGSGGLLDDANATIETCRAALWDYNGKIPSPVVAMAVTFQPDPDPEGGVQPKVVQYYSAGDPKNFVPSQDGHKFVPVGDATGLNDNCNAMAFIISMLNAVNGFPADKLSDDLSVFDGVKVYVKRMPQPKRPGLVKAADQKGDGKILLVQKILSFPWDSQGAVPKKAGKAAGPKVVQGPGPVASQAAAAGALTPTGLVEKGVSTMLGILSGKGGSITKAQIAQEAFKVLQKDPDRNELMKMLYSDAFLKGAHGEVPWEFDGTTITMG